MFELKFVKAVGVGAVGAAKTLWGWIVAATVASGKLLALKWAQFVVWLKAGAVAFKAKAIAATVMVGKIMLLVGVILLLVAVLASVYFMWDSLVEAFKIRGEQIVNNFKLLGSVISFIFNRASQNVRRFALNAKQWISEALEGTINKGINAINAMIRAYNALNPLHNIKQLSNVSMSVDVSSDLSALDKEMKETDRKFRASTFGWQLKESQAQFDLEKVRMQAGADLKEGWDKILSIGKGDIDIPDMDPGDIANYGDDELMKTLQGQKGSTSEEHSEFCFNITNNIEGGRGLDDMDEFDRQMTGYEEMVRRRIGTSPSHGGQD